jgi:phosphoribosyl-dephospho-CoA transferase
MVSSPWRRSKSFGSPPRSFAELGAYRGAMSDPRKHHFVAQTYQRGFARRKGKSFQVRILNKATGDDGIHNVRDAFSQRDWNTIKTEDGLKEFGVERVLAEHIDAEAAAALAATREHDFPLSRPDREALAMFMAAQLSRGRAVREGLAESIVEVHRLLLREAAASYSDERLREVTGREPSAELRDMMANSEKYLEIQPTNAMLLQAMFSSVQEIAELLDKRTWTLARFSSPCLFTGEHPFVHINPSGESLGFGVITAEQLYLPTSPTQAVLLSHPWTSWPDARVEGATELATRLNWAMLTHPSNEELLLHPNVPSHPLPPPSLFARNGVWPWGEDPEAKRGPPVSSHRPRQTLGRLTFPFDH